MIKRRKTIQLTSLNRSHSKAIITGKVSLKPKLANNLKTFTVIFLVVTISINFTRHLTRNLKQMMTEASITLTQKAIFTVLNQLMSPRTSIPMGNPPNKNQINLAIVGNSILKIISTTGIMMQEPKLSFMKIRLSSSSKMSFLDNNSATTLILKK